MDAICNAHPKKNHSCDPATYIDTENLQIIALRDISKGDELTFFYPSTEWEMIQPFQCNCQAQNCIKEVKGAKEFLRNDDLKTLLAHPHSPHILKLIQQYQETQ